jgi:CHASE2 domain-containing sensor protein
VAKSSSGRSHSRQFWSTDWFVGVLVVLAVLLLRSGTDFFGTLERRYDDFASTSASRQPSERIAIIAIDDQSIANIGRWPWPGDLQANLINQLAVAKAKTVVNTTLLFEPLTDRGMVFIRLGPLDIKLNVDESVQIGKVVIKTDESAMMSPQFYKVREGKPAFAADTFYDVVSGKIQASKYTDRIVIIGGTAVGMGTFFNTPAGPGLSAAGMMAHITSSILSQHFIEQPAWSRWATLALSNDRGGQTQI